MQPLDRRSLALATISTVVEWYDFTLFLYLTTVLSRLFFVGENAVLTTLAGFAVAYLLRPIGAIVFGVVFLVPNYFAEAHGYSLLRDGDRTDLMLLASTDLFRLSAWLSAVLIVVVWFTRRPAANNGPVAAD